MSRVHFEGLEGPVVFDFDSSGMWSVRVLCLTVCLPLVLGPSCPFSRMFQAIMTHPPCVPTWISPTYYTNHWAPALARVKYQPQTQNQRWVCADIQHVPGAPIHGFTRTHDMSDVCNICMCALPTVCTACNIAQSSPPSSRP